MLIVMQKWSWSLTEKIILLLVALMLVTGFVLFYANRELFMRYTYEDGIVEWLTVFGLLLGSAVCIYRFVKLLRKRNGIFLAVTLLLGIMLFVVAGEEISWGQRILGIESSDFFQKNNLQKETNFHNLVVDGVKVNKVIFTFGLIAALGIFLLVLPYLYRRYEGIKRWADGWGILIPQPYQIAAFLLLFVITALLRHDKNAELLECGGALLFFLIVRYPANAGIFNSERRFS
jgi:cell division protein FtsW (lipid II flippase)